MLIVCGIPSCSTVKKARAWLTAHHAVHTFVDLRQTPPNLATVQRWAAVFGVQAMKNTSGGAYRALPEAKAAFTDTHWMTLFVRDPMLIKRPVIERGTDTEPVPVLVGFRASDTQLRALLL